MFKRLFFASCLLVTSVSSHAALISYNGYERDSTSEIVTGGGLEWLKWDVTNGMSVNSALATYRAQGWMLATRRQMVDLFNVFQFGVTDWSAALGSNEGDAVPWSAGETSSHASFIKLFGKTMSEQCVSESDVWCYSLSDPYVRAQVFHGSFWKAQNSDGSYDAGSIDFAYVVDDSNQVMANYIMSPQSASAELANGMSMSGTTSFNGVGVALVRPQSSGPITVPAPNPFSLFFMSLAFLAYRRR